MPVIFQQEFSGKIQKDGLIDLCILITVFSHFYPMPFADKGTFPGTNYNGMVVFPEIYLTGINIKQAMFRYAEVAYRVLTDFHIEKDVGVVDEMSVFHIYYCLKAKIRFYPQKEEFVLSFIGKAWQYLRLSGYRGSQYWRVLPRSG